MVAHLAGSTHTAGPGLDTGVASVDGGGPGTLRVQQKTPLEIKTRRETCLLELLRSQKMSAMKNQRHNPMKIQESRLEEHPVNSQQRQQAPGRGGGDNQFGLASDFFILVTALEAVHGGEKF